MPDLASEMIIGVDWGTSSFRAYRLRGREVLERRESGGGILQVDPGGFAAALRREIGPWLEGNPRVLMAGMVGSRQGWVEAPYVACPAGPAELARRLVDAPFERAQVRIVPGLEARDADGVPEVIRGEETQIAGVLRQIGSDATACLPGSHSKWVTIRGGRIEGFATHLTGEAYAALRGHTILGRMMRDGETDRAAFRRGVARSGQKGGLLHHLFGVRTQSLFGQLSQNEAGSYLSGLLIGHEVRAAAPDGTVHLIGAEALCALYALALEGCGVEAVVVAGDAAASGLALIAELALWD
ncbi:MAG TPA: 2-dehydro-3-deoxygalactonokinase [Acetobacteraceae bacterium]|jgi:2-dehydro-3-deoxygalactonokinase|nr:2-dehydro-3-deoxygalactonokinase [Acetobacteraceae bacterium]